MKIVSKIYLCSSILVCLLMPLITYSGPGRLSSPREIDTYKYELEINNNDEVCNYMSGVYNYQFSRLFDFRGFSKKMRMENPAKYSEYPTSDVFEAIEWKWRGKVLYERSNTTRPLYVAEFDIDNDGSDEIIIKSWFYNGSKNGLGDNLVIYEQGEFDPDAERSDKDIVKNNSGELANTNIPGLITRPFIYEGKAYLSVYYSRHNDGKPNTGVMEVMEYKDRKKSKPWSNENLERICSFSMSHDPY